MGLRPATLLPDRVSITLKAVRVAKEKTTFQIGKYKYR